MSFRLSQFPVGLPFERYVHPAQAAVPGSPIPLSPQSLTWSQTGDLQMNPQRWLQDLEGRVGHVQSPLGEVAYVTTQGIGTGYSNQDGLGGVVMPDGSIAISQWDGLGERNGSGYVVDLAIAAYQREMLSSGSVEQALRLARAAAYCFSQSVLLHPHMSPDTFAQEVRDIKTLLGQDSHPVDALARHATRSSCVIPEGIQEMMRKNLGGDAVFAGAMIQPPSVVGGRPSLHAHWIGDARVYVLRRGYNGRWYIIYRSVDHSVVREKIKKGKIQAGRDYVVMPPDSDRRYVNAGRKTTWRKELFLNLHSESHLVTKSLARLGGESEDLVFSKTEEGEIPDPTQPTGYREAHDLKEGIQLARGDVVVCTSDGLINAFGSERHWLDFLQDCHSAQEVVTMSSRQAHNRMKVVETIKEYNLGSTLVQFLFPRRPQLTVGVFDDGLVTTARDVQYFQKGMPVRKARIAREIDHIGLDHFGMTAFMAA